ncbi:MAG: lipoxygenase family protein [Pseudomonadota bacterium]|nr:lipoxygenase family protein [Pseudomonadota bacterium]
MLLSNPRNRPSLPQDDNPREQQLRRDQIAGAEQTYQWTDQVSSLPGVPLARSVPDDDRPTIAWLLEVAEVAIDIAANQLLVKISGGDRLLAQSGGPALQSHLDDMRRTVAVIRREHETPGASVLGVVAHAASALACMHRIRLNSQLDALQALIASSYLDDSAPRGLERYRNLFITLPLPAIADEFMQNDAFARMRVAGPNSLLLQGIEQLPANFRLSNAQYQQVMGATDDLASALSQQRLYLIDYAELQTLVPGTTDGAQKYVSMPIALFAVPSGGRSLVPVAIQLGQQPDSNTMFLRVDSNASPGWWAWQMARNMVQVAEGNYHELFVHLARTHLLIEAFAVATHRQLAAEHPVNALLLPHFEGTLFINNAAAGSLIAAGGPIDMIFAGTIASTQKTAVAGRLGFDFYAYMLPSNLKQRRVDDARALPDYPYRDDALLVWNAIHDWVRDYVNVYYHGDADILADYELIAWTTELQSLGKIKGFTVISSRAQLTEVLTMIVFTASAQHAAVNFPQRTLMSYAPAISGAAWAPAPVPTPVPTEAEWLKVLPPIPQAQQQLSTLWLLGSVLYRPLGDYRLNHWPYPSWFRDPRITQSGGPLQRFQAALKVVDAQIDERNLQRAVQYEYLKPSLIPTSINI